MNSPNPTPPDLKPSIRATYDSRHTGDRYHVTVRIDGETAAFQERIPDPFVRQTVHVARRDLLRALLRGELVVEVIVGGDTEVVDDVLELDENTLIHGRTRRAAFQQSIHGKLAALGESEGS